MESGLQEIRREKVFVSPDMNIKDLMKKYGIAETTARRSREKGWLIKNYSKPQVIIDREHFNAKTSYAIARQVFFKKFRFNPVALSLKDDLIQEAVYSMFTQSGKVRAGANERYNEKYCYWWTAANAMTSFLKKWVNKTKDECELQTDYHPMVARGNRVWIPDYGWQYC